MASAREHTDTFSYEGERERAQTDTHTHNPNTPFHTNNFPLTHSASDYFLGIKRKNTHTPAVLLRS